eukprot:gene20224-20792_t
MPMELVIGERVNYRTDILTLFGQFVLIQHIDVPTSTVIEQQHHEELPTDIDENISSLVNEEDESLMDKESDLWETALRKLLSTNAKI